jgi:hypothetical protein
MFQSFLRTTTKSVGLLALIGIAAVAGVPAAQAQTITTLFNTGVDNSNAVLAGGAADTHYTMVANNAGLTNGVSALVNTDQLIGTWAANATSKYISPDGAQGGTPNGGSYQMTYRTTFTLPANVVLSSVNIVGNWSVDNLGNNILINGNSTGFTAPGFNSFTPFTLPTTFYQVGTNNLDFVWTNQGGPGGINVFFTTKTFQTGAAAAPEPGTLALLGLGVLPLAGVVLRKRRAL